MKADRYQPLRDAIAAHSEIYLPDKACEYWRWYGASPSDVGDMLADIDRLRAAVRGLLDALPSATTHPAIKAARAALADGEADHAGVDVKWACTRSEFT